MAAADGCETNWLNWLLLLFTVLTTYVNWWALQLPILWAKENGGIKEYIYAVSWECTRLHLPGVSATISFKSRTYKDWVSRYYTGRSENMRPTKRITTVVTDILTILGAIIAVYRETVLLSGSEHPDESGLNGSFYLYPLLPVAVFGLCITISAWMKWRLWVAIAFTTAVFLLVGTAVVLVVWAFDKYHIGDWIMVCFGYVLMGFPALFPIVIRLVPAILLMSAAIRNVPIIAGATSPAAYFPFCQLKTWAFAAPLLAIAILAALGALVGFIWAWRRLTDELEAAKQQDMLQQQQQDMQQQQQQQHQQGYEPKAPPLIASQGCRCRESASSSGVGGRDHSCPESRKRVAAFTTQLTCYVAEYADQRRRDDEVRDREEARRDELRRAEKARLAESERRRIDDMRRDRMTALEERGAALAIEIEALGSSSVATFTGSGDAAREPAAALPSVELVTVDGGHSINEDVELLPAAQDLNRPK
ncbi:hypothetical protein HK405_014542 [Cladochytrium tenue]|nr:hypothetical protein HK405_014542 [Cladochytrium tenue]